MCVCVCVFVWYPTLGRRPNATPFTSLTSLIRRLPQTDK